MKKIFTFLTAILLCSGMVVQAQTRITRHSDSAKLAPQMKKTISAESKAFMEIINEDGNKLATSKRRNNRANAPQVDKLHTYDESKYNWTYTPYKDTYAASTMSWTTYESDNQILLNVSAKGGDLAVPIVFNVNSSKWTSNRPPAGSYTIDETGDDMTVSVGYEDAEGNLYGSFGFYNNSYVWEFVSGKVFVTYTNDQPFILVIATNSKGKSFQMGVGTHPSGYSNDEKMYAALNLNGVPAQYQMAQRTNGSTNVMRLSAFNSTTTPQWGVYLDFVVESAAYNASYIPSGAYEIKSSGTPRVLQGTGAYTRSGDWYQPTPSAMANFYISNYNNYSDLYYLRYGTVWIINPNKSTSQPMYVNYYAWNSWGFPCIGKAWTKPEKRSVTVSIAGIGTNGSATISCPEGYGYANSDALDFTTDGEYYYDGTNISLQAPSANTGYHFVNWTKGGSQVATSARYPSSGTISVSSSNSGAYVANFAANTYKVKFNANDGTGTMSDQNFTYGAAQNLTANAFTAPTGKEFAGWATSQANANNGIVAHTDKKSVSNLTATQNGTVNLYAVWIAASTYTLTLDVTGNGTVTVHDEDIDANVEFTNGEAEVGENHEVTITATPATGYELTTLTFAGEDANQTEAYGVVEDNTAITATFSPKTYTVNLNNQSATTAGATSVTATYNAAMPSIASSLPAKTGHTFHGYFTETNGGGTKYYNADGTSAANWTIDVNPSELKAYWTVNNYNLTWTTDGDALTGTYTNGSTAYGTSIVAPATPTKTGYTFAGWNVTPASTMPAANTTYTATWTPNENTPYVVKHYQQNLDGTYPSTPTETDNLTGTTATEVTPAVNSYEGFTAPSTQKVSILADGSRVVEYQYTRNSYTLTWNANGGNLTGGTTAGSVPYGTPLTAPTATKSGFDFTGWTTAVPATMPAEAFSTTAQWIEVFALIDTYNDDEEGAVYYSNLESKIGQTMNVRYEREFPTNQWAAFSLPFGYSFQTHPEEHPFKGHIYYLISAEYEIEGEGEGKKAYLTLNCMPNTTGIVANKPYVFIPAAQITSDNYPVFRNVTIKKQKENYYRVPCTNIGVDDPVEQVEFRNTLTRMQFANNDHRQIYLASGKLRYPNNGTYIRAFRGYFYMTGGGIQHVQPRLRNIETGEIIEAPAEENAETMKYIENGVLIIERAGMKYDAQGHIIK